MDEKEKKERIEMLKNISNKLCENQKIVLIENQHKVNQLGNIIQEINELYENHSFQSNDFDKEFCRLQGLLLAILSKGI